MAPSDSVSAPDLWNSPNNLAPPLGPKALGPPFTAWRHERNLAPAPEADILQGERQRSEVADDGRNRASEDMRIAICGSMTFMDEMEAIAAELRPQATSVATPLREEREAPWESLSLEDAVRR